MARDKKPEGLKGIHLQARLLPDKVREADAVEAYRLIAQTKGWSDRVLITEALIALRVLIDKGYTPQPVETEIRLTAKMQRALNLLMDHVAMLSQMDLTSARQAPDWNEQRWQETTAQLHDSVADLFGAARQYDDDDEE